ncbi:MAG: hypothetical protein ACRCU6_05760 [Fusobacteriaceae bacterium]
MIDVVKKEIEVGAIFISALKAFKCYGKFLGIRSKTAFYDFIYKKKFIVGKIGRRILVLEQSIKDYLGKTLQERANFIQNIGLKDYWKNVCHMYFTGIANPKQIGKILGIDPRLIRRYLKMNRGEFEVEMRDNGHGSDVGHINPVIITDIMMDIDE